MPTTCRFLSIVVFHQVFFKITPHLKQTNVSGNGKRNVINTMKIKISFRFKGPLFHISMSPYISPRCKVLSIR